MKIFPEDLLYSREHIWVRIDGDMATLGITDYAQERLGEILSVEFPEIDTYVERDETFGSVESTKAVIDLVSPVSGTIVSVNEDINDDIGIINSDPHDIGWLVVIEMDDLGQLDDLLDAAGYQDFIMQEEDTD
ncbi:MAG: glycine cleavage system protein H [Deltaproteobacteria bacterium HGW-Deltaproteobacteria-10]|nr:MAG: glycine cleavage system protein H [Deltaproteobacteria bacterium HGW-Deltaproteobacteria-10]